MSKIKFIFIEFPYNEGIPLNVETFSCSLGDGLSIQSYVHTMMFMEVII